MVKLMESNPATASSDTSVYRVWDLPVRVFHWVNLILVFTLLFIGLIMLFKQELGITGLEAKVGLKTCHVVVGYIFTVNLLLRFVWGFFGNRLVKVSEAVPSLRQILGYLGALKQGRNPQYLGHNPLGKLAVFVIVSMLSIIMLSGLIRAGTDIYYPPFGSIVTQYIALDGVDSASLKPYDVTGVNSDKSAQLKPYKSLAGTIHLYSVYFLLLILVLHIIAVIRAENHHQPGIISAMFSGNKTIKGKPEDL